MYHSGVAGLEHNALPERVLPLTAIRYVAIALRGQCVFLKTKCCDFYTVSDVSSLPVQHPLSLYPVSSSSDRFLLSQTSSQLYLQTKGWNL